MSMFEATGENLQQGLAVSVAALLLRGLPGYMASGHAVREEARSKMCLLQEKSKSCRSQQSGVEGIATLTACFHAQLCGLHQQVDT